MDESTIRHCQLLRDSKGVLYMCWYPMSRRDSGYPKRYYRFAHPMPYAWEQLSHPVIFVKTVPLEADVSTDETRRRDMQEKDFKHGEYARDARGEIFQCWHTSKGVGWLVAGETQPLRWAQLQQPVTRVK